MIFNSNDQYEAIFQPSKKDGGQPGEHHEILFPGDKTGRPDNRNLRGLEGVGAVQRGNLS
jgi:hypothetical protein